MSISTNRYVVPRLLCLDYLQARLHDGRRDDRLPSSALFLASNAMSTSGGGGSSGCSTSGASSRGSRSASISALSTNPASMAHSLPNTAPGLHRHPEVNKPKRAPVPSEMFTWRQRPPRRAGALAAALPSPIENTFFAPWI